MYANLKPFSIMGVPNKIASSEKDVHVATKLDFYDNRLQDTQETLSAPPPKIRLPRRGGGGGVVDGGDEDGYWCTTPKAEEREEVVLLKCPPPPRKPKSKPLRKRKAQRDLLDLSKEIDSMFPSNILRDFMCGKIKKFRTGCSEII